MHSIIPLKILVSDRHHIPLFVWRSCVKVSEFSLTEGALSKRALDLRGLGFLGGFQQFWKVCAVTNLEQCSTARYPSGCWAFSALSLKASRLWVFLMISLERSFRDSRILPWVPKDRGRLMSVISTMSSWESFRSTSLSLLPTFFQWLEVTIDVKRSFFQRVCREGSVKKSWYKILALQLILECLPDILGS